MKIGIITHNYPLTSKERKDAGIFLHDFAQKLASNNEVFILAPNFKGAKEKYKKVPVTWFKWRGGDNKLGNMKLNSPSSVIAYLSLIINGIRATDNFQKNNNLDFIIAAWSFPAGVFALYATIRKRVPYATWSLGSDINIYAKYPVIRSLIKFILRRAYVRFANSYALCEEVKKLSGKKTIFLPAITDLAFNVVKRSKNTRFKFLFVGRLEPVKGPDTLIMALNNLPKDNSWSVVIGGDGSLDNNLKQSVKVNHLEKYVHFLGRLNEKEVRHQMTTSDCLVVPSRSESLPLVMIEAARARLPIIASDVGDCKRLINHYKIGYCFSSANTDELAQNMKKMIKVKKSTFHLGLKRFDDEYKQENAVKIFLTNVEKK